MTQTLARGAQPLVSVIVLNHNGLAIVEVLRRCLEAVVTQDYPHIEPIAVDDNSTDGSDEALAAICRELGVTYVSTRDGKHGICAARNRGIAVARGEYYAFLDNDAVPQPGWLAALVALMEAVPRLGACASRVMFADRPDVVNSMGSVLNDLFHGNGVCIHELYAFARPPAEVMYATGNGMTLRRTAVEQVGPFDEGLLFYTPDDADYGLRLRRAGWAIAPCPDAEVLHLHSFSKTQQGMSFWDRRNRIRMALKHLSWRELLGFVPHDLRANARPSALGDYARCWWSTLSDWDGLRGLTRYRWQHRGEPGFRKAFVEYLGPERGLIVTPDNRACGREKRPLGCLVMGSQDDAHLYHGWYWVEHVGGEPMRWARQVASLVGSLPNGASRLHLRLVTPPDGEDVLLVAHVQRQDGVGWQETAQMSLALPGGAACSVQQQEFSCELPPGDYRLILAADRAPVERSPFPRQISFGLSELRVDPAE